MTEIKILLQIAMLEVIELSELSEGIAMLIDWYIWCQ